MTVTNGNKPWVWTVGALVFTALVTAIVSGAVQDWRGSGARIVTMEARSERAQDTADRAIDAAASSYALAERARSLAESDARELAILSARSEQQYAEILRRLDRIERVLEGKWPQTMREEPN